MDLRLDERGGDPGVSCSNRARALAVAGAGEGAVNLAAGIIIILRCGVCNALAQLIPGPSAKERALRPAPSAPMSVIARPAWALSTRVCALSCVQVIRTISNF
jgi:hypothetical protein